ncbi:MAG: pimeloyl-CoA dehydrogenase large subunit, partial [Alphaproteobacteria bacterium]|nr:pimeloyl-CoA dehydrogenase large subunit [Alphaproteobacteria bacterium]
MDLNYTEEEIAFRDEVRAFLDAELPNNINHKVKNHLRLSREDMVEWHAILNKRGWLAANWPEEHGGAAWNAVQRN